MTVKLLITNT